MAGDVSARGAHTTKLHTLLCGELLLIQVEYGLEG